MKHFLGGKIELILKYKDFSFKLNYDRQDKEKALPRYVFLYIIWR